MISAQKPESIRGMFDRLAGRYDLTNTVLSLGSHRLWKKRLVHEAARGLERLQDIQILDCATGTGDIAELWSRHLSKRVSASSVKILATDFSEGMLAEAKKRAEARASQLEVPVQFEWADIENLTYSDQSFDRVTISFGIRNVADPVRGLSELGRVLKSGGELWVLEFGQPQLPVFAQAYRFYSGNILPLVGGFLSGHRDAYRYLNQSSERFPCGEAFLQMAQKTGAFSQYRAISLSGGIAFLYQLVR